MRHLLLIALFGLSGCVFMQRVGVCAAEVAADLLARARAALRGGWADELYRQIGPMLVCLFRQIAAELTSPRGQAAGPTDAELAQEWLQRHGLVTK